MAKQKKAPAAKGDDGILFVVFVININFYYYYIYKIILYTRVLCWLNSLKLAAEQMVMEYLRKQNRPYSASKYFTHSLTRSE